MSGKTPAAARPIVIIPYVWIGDFVRCHSVVKLLRLADPARPVDIVSSTLCAPLADYMPGVRRAIVADIPRRRLGRAPRRAQIAAHDRPDGCPGPRQGRAAAGQLAAAGTGGAGRRTGRLAGA